MRKELMASTTTLVLLMGAAVAQDQKQPAEDQGQAAQQVQQQPAEETTGQAQQSAEELEKQAEQAKQEAEQEQQQAEEQPLEEQERQQAEEQPVDEQQKAEQQAAAAGVDFIKSQKEGQGRAEEWIGVDVITADDEDVGEVKDLLLDDQNKIAGVVLSVGGFLGIGEKSVAVPFDAVQRQEGAIRVSLDSGTLEDAPAFATREEVEAAKEAQEQQLQMQQQQQQMQQQMQQQATPEATSTSQ